MKKFSLLTIVLFLCLVWSCSPIMLSEKGVAITTKEADVFLGPNWDQKYYMTLAPDTPLTLLGMVRDWYQIRLPDGSIAWVHKSNVKLIPWGNMFTLKKSRIRKGPGLNTEIIKVVPEGTSLTHLGEYGEWYHVALKDGTTGWIYKSLAARK